MKINDVIAKREEYRRLEKVREELKLFREKIDALYTESKAIYHNDTTSRLIDREILDKIKDCEGELKKQLSEMEI